MPGFILDIHAVTSPMFRRANGMDPRDKPGGDEGESRVVAIKCDAGAFPQSSSRTSGGPGDGYGACLNPPRDPE